MAADEVDGAFRVACRELGLVGVLLDDLLVEPPGARQLSHLV